MNELALVFVAGAACGWVVSRMLHLRALRRLKQSYECFLPAFLRRTSPPDVSIKDDWLHVDREPQAVRTGRFCVHQADGTIITFGSPPKRRKRTTSAI